MSTTVTYKGSTIATVNNNTKTLKTSGTYMEDDVTLVDVSSGGTYQAKTNINPTTSSQTITPDNGYDALSSVQINAMPSGTEGTPTATKGTVSNNSISVTPSVTNTAGYISGGTKTGTAVTVSASELVSGTRTITENGTGIDVTNYGSVDVTVPSGGLTTVTILPAQSVTATTTHSNGSYSVYLDNISENLIAGTSYLVTIDGDAYICHADTAWDSVYAGDVEVIWGDPSNVLYPFMLGSYTNNRTEFGYGDNSAHTVKIERVVSFSAPELISKSITANGTYDPADDDADGYSEVIVNVSGGGGTTWTTLRDGNVTIVSSSPNYIIVNNFNTPLAANEVYRITWGNVTYTFTTEEDESGTSYDGYFVGNVGVIGGTDDGSGIALLLYHDRADRIVGVTTDAAGTKYLKIEKQVSGGGGNYQVKTGITPTTSSQTITADSGYDALESVQINAMPTGTAGTPTATKGTVSNHAVSVTPSVTNTTGYITGSTINGTAVSVSASELVSGSETKTTNGTYDVTNLAELVVNVSGGASNVVTGTFKGTTTGTAMDVTLNYSGSGYPIAAVIYPTEGPYNGNTGTFYDLIKRYSFALVSITKCEIGTAPVYSSGDVSDTKNRASVCFIYKNSTSSATTYSRQSYMDAGVYRNSNANATWSSTGNACVKFKSNTTMSVYIIGTSNYGFAPNIEYKYWVIYSS